MGTHKKNGLTFAITAMMAVVLLLAGCGGSPETQSEQQPGQSSLQATTPADGGNKDTAEASVAYPNSLTYYVTLNPNPGATMKSYSEHLAYQELEKRTGVKVEFQHPSSQQTQDQFNLMLASGKYPDVIEWQWSNVAKGPDNAINDQVILRLNELIAEHAPNLSRLMDKDPNIRRLITSDDGNIYVFPFLNEVVLKTNGLVLRKDWLDRLNLDVPTTIDEWHAVLTAFKEQDPNGNGEADEIPLLLEPAGVWMQFLGAWGVQSGFYQENGAVKYGLTQPEFGQFLATMNQWYREGLIDPDFAATDKKLQDAKLTGHKLGALGVYGGSHLGQYVPEMAQKDPAFKLISAPYPVMQQGVQPLPGLAEPYGVFGGHGAAITTANPDPAGTARWLDYKYGEEGHMLFNFGMEGVSYTMDNGYPRFMPTVTNDPGGLPLAHSLSRHIISNFSGPLVQDKRMLEQYLGIPEQQEAIRTWNDGINVSKYLPPLLPTSEESTALTKIMADINTYRSEMITKFIIGSEPLDRFDKFVNTIESMGIEEATAIQQSMLDRYNARN